MSDAPERPDAAAEQSGTEQSGGTERSNTGSTDVARSNTPQPAPAPERPRPEFGEYAPEGWEWKPEGADADGPATGSRGETDPSDARGGPIQGVPHNLGVTGARPASGPARPAAPAAPAAPSADPVRTPAPPTSTPGTSVPQAPAPQAPTPPVSGSPEQSSPGAPYRAAPPAFGEAAPGAAPVIAPAPLQAPGAAQPKSRTADRVITIILLVIGAFSALSIAQSMMGLPMSLRIIADALEIADFSVPDWVGTLGVVSAIAVIAIYAVTLIYSIQRMRARKLTFWVPLAVGVGVAIAVFVITMIVMMGQPQLMQALEDPDAMNRLLEHLSGTAAP